MKFSSGIFLGILSFTFLFSSCGSSSDDGDIVSNDTSAVKTEERSAQTKKILESIPSPVETVALLKAAGAKYNTDYLNPLENLSKYSVSASKAINLGVYGTDLSFTSVFDKTQESMLYLRCANTLSHDMGIMGVFDENTSARLEANQNDKDSLLAIISESFRIADTYLNNNGQPGLSTLIVAGGWVEGLYIATRIANDTKSPEVLSQIVKQEESLDNLIILLKSLENESEDVKKALAQLNELKAVYDKVQGKPADSAQPALTAEELKQITDKTKDIRTKFISQ